MYYIWLAMPSKNTFLTLLALFLCLSLCPCFLPWLHCLRPSLPSPSFAFSTSERSPNNNHDQSFHAILGAMMLPLTGLPPDGVLPPLPTAATKDKRRLTAKPTQLQLLLLITAHTHPLLLPLLLPLLSHPVVSPTHHMMLPMMPLTIPADNFLKGQPTTGWVVILRIGIMMMVVAIIVDMVHGDLRRTTAMRMTETRLMRRSSNMMMAITFPLPIMMMMTTMMMMMMVMMMTNISPKHSSNWSLPCYVPLRLPGGLPSLPTFITPTIPMMMSLPSRALIMTTRVRSFACILASLHFTPHLPPSHYCC